ncbi:calcium-binding protein, partial [Dolichospermum planctonicum UHCC 0167]|uniref:calcium-binding protein n=1 Tax=Dolichospermum planctonicum TaxID=136072 RepID=UPI001443334A
EGDEGNDTYYVDNTGDVVTEGSGPGNDSVFSTATYTLPTNVENLTLTGTAVNGTGNELDNIITGNSANNTLNGGVGNDTLSGSVGADTLDGGAGDDTYYVDNTADIVTEVANGGTDMVLSGITYTLAAGLEKLALTGLGAINGTGNGEANTITGNSANNTLNGDAGDDTLNGGVGNDSLNGGVGNDSLNGGAGTDTLIGGLGNDTYIVDSTTDTITENANEGTDTIQSSVT